MKDPKKKYYAILSVNVWKIIVIVNLSCIITYAKTI